MTISAFSRGEVVRFGGSPEHCSVAPPGIDTAPFVAVGEAERRRFRRRFALDDRRVILTVARLDERKGHDVVLAAMASLVAEYDDLHYLIVGQGDPGRLRSMAGDLGVADRLTVVPFLETADLPSAYAAADLFAMASRPDGRSQVEGFGIVYLEAAATGLPCVAGVLGGCPDAVQDGVTGWCVDPLSAPAVAGALRSLLASPSWRQTWEPRAAAGSWPTTSARRSRRPWCGSWPTLREGRQPASWGSHAAQRSPRLAGRRSGQLMQYPSPVRSGTPA